MTRIVSENGDYHRMLWVEKKGPDDLANLSKKGLTRV